MPIRAAIRLSKSGRFGVAAGALLASFALAAFAWPGAAARNSAASHVPGSDQADSAVLDDAALLDGFRHVEAASVSDALEQITGKKMYMSHHMRPIFPTKFAGYAVTVLLKKEPNHDPNALSGMLDTIDHGGPNSIYVMVVEDGADIAGMGGLMGTAMSSRNFSGAVIDGGVRDVAYLRKIAFPVYASGIVPSTSVGHYRATQGVPVTCGGIRVAPGDVVVADADGVVTIPKDIAAAVLVKAQALDQTEHSMYGYIEKFRSLEEAVQRFGRL
jgi:regulator of RNase E activity RraA